MMYLIVESEEVIRIPPNKIGEKYEETAKIEAIKKMESRVGILDRSLVRDSNDRKYIVLMVLDASLNGEGYLVHGDGGVYQPVKVKALAYQPNLQEVVEGEVTDITKIGAFVRIGPVEALLHISQIMDDRLDIDLENKKLIGRETKRDLKVGDVIRARIVSISIADSISKGVKIGLTLRQNFLGKLSWLKGENQ